MYQDKCPKQRPYQKNGEEHRGQCIQARPARAALRDKRGERAWLFRQEGQGLWLPAISELIRFHGTLKTGR
jgi:hypothetical protein